PAPPGPSTLSLHDALPIWQRELLDGLLGADLVGFHVLSHCQNFLGTVDRTLESRIEEERLAVNRQDHLTEVRPFPISVALEEPADRKSTRPNSSHLGISYA